MLSNRQDPKVNLSPISPDWTHLSIDVLFKTLDEYQTGYYDYQRAIWITTRGDYRYRPKDVIAWWYLKELE